MSNVIHSWELENAYSLVMESTVTVNIKGRLHHINDGANAPWKKQGVIFVAFFRNLGGSSDKFIVALISSAN